MEPIIKLELPTPEYNLLLRVINQFSISSYHYLRDADDKESFDYLTQIVTEAGEQLS